MGLLLTILGPNFWTKNLLSEETALVRGPGVSWESAKVVTYFSKRPAFSQFRLEQLALRTQGLLLLTTWTFRLYLPSLGSRFLGGCLLSGRSLIFMMLSSLLPSLWVRESGFGEEPLYSPYILSPSVALAAQAVNRSSSESEMDC